MAAESISGACLCGNVTFKLSGNPDKVLACYCTDCQKNAGGLYQVMAAFPKGQIKIRDPAGFIKIYTIRNGTQSGLPKAKHFCANCGCTLWTVPGKYNGEIRMVRTSLIEDGLTRYPAEKEIFRQD